jgi:DNA primase
MRSDLAQSGVLAYLTSHAINDKSIVAKYELGYVAEPLPGDEMYHGRLAVPYLSRNGVVSIKFRRLGETGTKYLYHKGQRPRLFNTIAYFEADDTLGLCEGEIDAIVATERLGVPTIGIPGVDTWMEQADSWKPIFKDFRTVLMFADGDDAGHNLADAVSESIGTRLRVVACTPGQDVASTVASGDFDHLLVNIQGA